MDTIKEAKELIEANMNAGLICPCCNQYVKLYQRKITSSMAYALVLIRLSRIQSHFHVEQFLKKQDCSSSIRGDFPKLRFWGLIELEKDSIIDVIDKASRQGFYRITKKGIDFVDNKLKVQKYVSIFNNKVYDKPLRRVEMISIKEALNDKFNYSELISSQLNMF